MVITKKEFASAARKAMYEVADETFKERDDDTVEGIACVTAIKFIKNAKAMFGESGEVDVSEEEFMDKMRNFSADACMDNAEVGRDEAFGVAVILTSILCTAVNARITTNIKKQFFEKKEESDGNREDN